MAGLLLFALLGAPPHFSAQEKDTRKVKVKVDPEYPELARRLKLQGMVRVQVTVSPDGSVKEVRELGGNPVLVNALLRAVKKWKYEATDKESVLEVKFEFIAPD